MTRTHAEQWVAWQTELAKVTAERNDLASELLAVQDRLAHAEVFLDELRALARKVVEDCGYEPPYELVHELDEMLTTLDKVLAVAPPVSRRQA